MGKNEDVGLAIYLQPSMSRGHQATTVDRRPLQYFIN